MYVSNSLVDSLYRYPDDFNKNGQKRNPCSSLFSAGVGRTGTFIGLWNLMEAVDGGSPASVNVQQIVLAMRECRCNMVQSPVLRAGRIGGEEWSKLS